MSALARPGAPQAAASSLDRVTIRGFRNLARAELAPPPEGMVLIGDNGQGKSNLIEALYYLQLLRSFRGARDQDMVAFEASGFHLAATVQGGRAATVSVGFERGRAGGHAGDAAGTPGVPGGGVMGGARRKRVRVDGVEPERLSDGIGAFPAVVVSPADSALVAGAPRVRRHFLDVVLALTSRSYLGALQQYRAALARRNAAMRASSAPPGPIEEAVAVWEPVLARTGALLREERIGWVGAHAAHYAELCRAIGECGSSALRYQSQLVVAPGASAEDALRETLRRKRALDIRRGLTHAGPHRDELALTLDGRDLRVFGSAGQHRTAAMALRLLEAATLREATGHEPVVLLDDPFAELDPHRAGHIMELLDAAGRGQTVLAIPRALDIPAGLSRLERWRIAGGVITPAPAARAGR